MEVLEGVGSFGKFGIIGIAFATIVYIVYMFNKNNQKQIDAYNANSEKDRDIIKSLTLEISQMNLSTTELITKTDLHSENVVELIKEIKDQVITIHERINNIAEKQTGIAYTTGEIKNIVNQCNKK